MNQHTFKKIVLVLIAAAIFPSGPGLEAAEYDDLPQTKHHRANVKMVLSDLIMDFDYGVSDNEADSYR